ncbi:MAG: amidohydrolase family protein [Clostridia bacterium]|jgi:predicted TIM-barrel fold metal-dependent hydrolase|nr:amidohydrolase family protein [Clostridia bacterium]MCI1959069.1 amidohydrolase family protein [Clostridia bacterium]MCI1998826.1 amidohydrolase family protein [Clostridia bacterium]MCI2013576.1 amidohydrolase family protein [Clostridia bacterium]
MIIDVHSHLGEDCVFDEELDERGLLDAYERNGVDGGIVQPYLPRIYMEDHVAIHNRIYELTKTKEKKIWGMASINPHFRPDDYDKEAYRCIKELGFVGIKITPIGHATHPSSKDAFHVWEVCRELKVPIMIHTGAGIPFSDPISVEKALEAFPDVTCVLAHAGSEMHNQQATYLARKFENVFLEPSWVGVIGVSNMIKQVGCTKILYSSDNVHNMPVELAKYRELIKNKDDLDNVLYKNAVRIYNLKI